MLPLLLCSKERRKAEQHTAARGHGPDIKGSLLALAPLLCLVCILIVVALHTFVPCAGAASASSPPHSGLEGGMGRAYGPDSEGRRAGKNTPQTSVPFDAYGNPITGEVEDAPRRAERPRPGAYGGYGKTRGAKPARPLPEPEAKPQWTFK